MRHAAEIPTVEVMNSGLRERKKADTRRALVETAVRLCLERGYRSVTVTDITDEVGVSRRTFSNYFDGLPQCLAGFGITVLDDVLEVLTGQPTTATSDDLLRVGLHSFADRVAGGLDEYSLLMASHPELVGAEFASQHEIVDRVGSKINELLQLGEGDLRATVMAGCLVQLTHIVGNSWIAAGRPGGVDGLKQQLDLGSSIFNLSALSAQ